MADSGEENRADDRKAQVNAQAAQASALLSARKQARREAAEAGPFGHGEASAHSAEGPFEGRLEGLPDESPAQSAGRLGGYAGNPDASPASADDYPVGMGRFLRRNAVYVAGVAVVAVIVAVLVVAAGTTLTGCSPKSNEGGTVQAYQSPYDWSKLDRTNGRYQYVADGQVKSRLGVDVSENQHEIDWNAVAADGIDFAIVRVGYRGATEGDLYLDEQYWANLDGARAAGLDCGVYFFSQAQTVDEAVEEADFVLEYLNGTSLEYPIVFDSEEVFLGMDQSRTTGLTNDQMTAIAQAFCNRVEQAGYGAMVYGNSRDMSRYDYGGIQSYPIWWAEYDTAAPNHDLDIALWQYSNSGEVAGIPTYVDMNIDLSNALG